MRNKKEQIKKRFDKIKELNEIIKSGDIVISNIKRYEGKVFIFKKVLPGIFNNNAAEVQDEEKNLFIIPLESLTIQEEEVKPKEKESSNS